MSKFVSDFREKYFCDKEVVFRLLAIIGASLFFAHELNIAVFVRIFEKLGLEKEIAVTISSIIPFMLSIPLLIKRNKKVKIFIVIYLLVAVFFVVSVLRNLNYLHIFFRPSYGIHKVFLPSGGMFALYYTLLIYDKDKQYDFINMILLSAIGLFIISLLQYLMAQFRGHWLAEGANGQLLKINYSLVFGFNMAFVVNLFLGFWFYKKKTIFLILSIIGYYTILTDGNRMAMLLPLLCVILFIIYSIFNYFKYKIDKADILRSFLTLMALVITLGGGIFLQKHNINPVSKLAKTIKGGKTENTNKNKEIIKEDGKLWYYEKGIKKAKGLVWIKDDLYYVKEDGSLVTSQKYKITKTNNILPKGEYPFDENGKLKITAIENNEKLLNLLISKKKNLSRNLSLVGANNFLFDNSRNKIYELVIQGIKDHPIIGGGAYSDRIYTSQRYIWGHSHNIVLELAINFGVIIAALILVFFINLFFANFAKKKSFYTIVFLSFVATAALLLSSNSFWLEPHIWTLLAISWIVLSKDDIWYYKIYEKIKRKK